MPEIKIVGRGVDTLVINVCYANEHFQPVKQELAKGVQHELEVLQGAARRREAAIPTRWSFKGMSLFMQEKGSRGQWRWILKAPQVSPLLTVAISRGRLSRVFAQVRLSSEYLWSCAYLAEAIVEVGLLLYTLFGEYLWFQVSAVDLCADIVGWEVSHTNWQEGFISRAVGENGRPVLALKSGQVVPVTCSKGHVGWQGRESDASQISVSELWKDVYQPGSV